MVVPGDLSWTNEAVELVCNGSAERTNKIGVPVLRIFVCESSYFEMDPRCHWEPVKFIEQWSGTAQSIRLQNDAGQLVLLALKLSGQGLRHAIHDGVGVVKFGSSPKRVQPVWRCWHRGWDECGEELGCGN